MTAPGNLGQLVVLWLWRALIAASATVAITYAADAAIFAMRGSPMDQVTVKRYLAVPLKGNKTEYDYQGAGPAPCARALFPQGANQPCWYLHNHTSIIQQI